MRLSYFVILLFAAVAAQASVVGKEVSYTADSLTMKAYLVYDDKFSGKRPGVLVVHEWWGNNDYSRKRADMLASLGYVALAVDMYGNGKVVDNPNDAGKLAAEVMANLPIMKSRFDAAMDFLKADDHVDPTRIAAIGYCFGGAVVLGMAREGADLKAVVSFHGNLATQHPAEMGKVKARILVCNGADDEFISAEMIKKFKDEMKAAGANLKFVNYPGAIHSFTNPASTELGKKFNIPLAYNEMADKESWAEMQKLFKKVLKK